jgi:hypothetical protein
MIDPFDSGLFPYGACDPRGVALAREPGVDQDRFAGGAHEECRRTTFDVDEIDGEGAGSAEALPHVRERHYGEGGEDGPDAPAQARIYDS